MCSKINSQKVKTRLWTRLLFTCRTQNVDKTLSPSHHYEDILPLCLVNYRRIPSLYNTNCLRRILCGLIFCNNQFIDVFQNIFFIAKRLRHRFQRGEMKAAENLIMRSNKMENKETSFGDFSIKQ